MSYDLILKNVRRNYARVGSDSDAVLPLPKGKLAKTKPSLDPDGVMAPDFKKRAAKELVNVPINVHDEDYVLPPSAAFERALQRQRKKVKRKPDLSGLTMKNEEMEAALEGGSRADLVAASRFHDSSGSWFNPLSWFDSPEVAKAKEEAKVKRIKNRDFLAKTKAVGKGMENLQRKWGDDGFRK